MNIIPNTFENPHAVQKKSLLNILMYFCLVMPDDFFGLITLYADKTPEQIAYKWLDFRFGIVSVLLLLFGIFMRSSQKKKELILIIVLIAREFLFYTMGKSNCFSENAYEIYLVIILAFCVVNIICSINTTLEERQQFMWRAVFLNIIIVYLSYLLHMNGIENRCNAPNMDVEATGVICGLATIFCLFSGKVNHQYLLTLVAIGGLILSGSRVNLLIVGFIILLGSFRIVLNRKTFDRGFLVNIIFVCYIVIFALIGLGTAASIFNIEIPFANSDMIKRMVDAVSLNSIESDSSVLGRSRSINIGFKIIRNHPFGISGFFTNLQLETQKYGFPTFPHSTFLTYYILLGPIIIALIVWMSGLISKAFRLDNATFLGMLYLFIFFCISGGPIASFKPIFFYMLFIVTAEITVIEKKANICSMEGERVKECF